MSTASSAALTERAHSDPDPTGLCVFDPIPLLTVTVEPSGEASAGSCEIHFHAGGQGLWIARMARRLGAEVTLVGCFGGEPGMLLMPLINDEGVPVVRSEMVGGNGAYIQDRRSGERVAVAESTPAALTRHEVDDLYDATLAVAVKSSATVLCGPRVEGFIPTEVYGRLTADLASLGRPVVADLAGAALQDALGGGLDVLKISGADMRRDGLLEGNEIAGEARLLHQLHRRGAGTVVLTRADQPALALVEGQALQIRCPPLQAVDHRGAGDAMTAAIAVALSSGAPMLDALRLGAAAGATAVTRRGLASGQQEAVDALLAYIDIEPIGTDPPARSE